MGVWSIILVVTTFLLLMAAWLDIPGALWRYYRLCKCLKPISSLPAHWFWGHILTMKDMDEKLWNLAIGYMLENKHRFIIVWFGPFLASIDVGHPEIVQKLIKEPKCRPVYRMLIPWLGEGLLIADGQKWYRSRRLLTPAFHFEILKPYIPVYNSCLEVMLRKWSVSVSKSEPVKLFETVSLLSLDIILQCAFSNKSDCQTLSRKHPYTNAVYDLIQLCTDRFMNPLYHIDWIYFITPSGRKMSRACSIVHEYALRVINERKRTLGLDKKRNKFQNDTELFQEVSKMRKYLDFLDILLTSVDENGKGLTVDEIRSEVDTFMFEGHDTTTSGISWTLYCLAKYPEHQEKVREEVRNVLMGREWLEYDDLKDLKYTQWCIKEAMRLYPPVFQFYRTLLEDVELDGYLIPKGVQVNITPFLIHRNPDIWENPNEYDPLRFHPINAEKRHPYAYIPFSAGYRNCIGQNFAMNEERLVVASIINRYSLSLDEDHEVKIALRVVLRTKNDIKVKLTPISSSV